MGMGQLTRYIQDHLDRGHSKEELIQLLQKHGYSEALIKSAFREIHQKPRVKPLHFSVAVNVLLVFALMFTFLTAPASTPLEVTGASVTDVAPHQRYSGENPLGISQNLDDALADPEIAQIIEAQEPIHERESVGLQVKLTFQANRDTEGFLRSVVGDDFTELKECSGDTCLILVTTDDIASVISAVDEENAIVSFEIAPV